MINVESAGEFPKTKVVFFLVQQFSTLAKFFVVCSIKRKEFLVVYVDELFSQLWTLLEIPQYSYPTL